jgi:hypothetical protein
MRYVRAAKHAALSYTENYYNEIDLLKITELYMNFRTITLKRSKQ